MTARAFFTLLSSALLFTLSAALSSRALFFGAAVLFLVFSYALLSVLLARRCLKVSARLQEEQVLRGEENSLTVKVRTRCFLPAGRATLTLLQEGEEEKRAAVSHSVRKPLQLCLPVSARHVGTYEIRLENVSVEDIYGLFRLKGKKKKTFSAAVLPRPFDIEKPTFSVSEEGSAALRRAAEDYSAPDDTRPFQPGDAMKRVQWKLYARKGDLLVRRYESPMPPDTLILMDCGKVKGENAETRARLIDALCETAVAVADLQMKDNQPVRLPLYGRQANEFSSDRRENLLVLQRMLAAQRFLPDVSFARTLREEMKRVRRSGAVVVLTTCLDADVTDALCDIRRLGPNVRCYLVTDRMEREEDLPYIGRLQHQLVEVCYVTPA